MLVIFDKDGTLVKPKSGGQFVTHPTDQELLPGVADRINELVKMGATMAIASNQGGVAAGHKSLDDAIEEMKYCTRLTGINHTLFCPDFEGKECYSIVQSAFFSEQYTISSSRSFLPAFQFENYRKPGAGMLKVLMALNGDGTQNAVMIGDRPEDEQASQAAGIPFVDADAWRTGEVSIALKNV